MEKRKNKRKKERLKKVFKIMQIFSVICLNDDDHRINNLVDDAICDV